MSESICENEETIAPEKAEFSSKRLGLLLLRLCLVLVVLGAVVFLIVGLQASGGSYRYLGLSPQAP